MSPSMNSLGNRGDFVCGHIQIKPYQPLVSSLVKTRLKRKPILYNAWSGIYCMFYIYELSWQNLGTASNIINFWRSTKASQIKYVENIVTLLLGCESIYINCFSDLLPTKAGLRCCTVEPAGCQSAFPR